MIKSFIIAFALLLPIAAHADCPTNLPFNEVSEKAAQLGVHIEKASDIIASALDKVAERPNGLENAEVFLMSNDNLTEVLLVKEGVIVCTSAPMETEEFKKMIGAVDANDPTDSDD